MIEHRNYMSKHTLYSDPAAHIIVLDLPASIADAQLSSLCLSSTPAIETPYKTPEPKGSKRDALIASQPPDETQYHADIQNVLRNALTLLHERWHEGPWCHVRMGLDQPCQSVPVSRCIAHEKSRVLTPPLVLSLDLNRVCCLDALSNIVVHNPLHSATALAVSEHEHFIVPAKSTFLCATVQDGLVVFEQAVKCLLCSPHFNLILLDPPWTNRSVRNSQAYRTTEDQSSDPFAQILPALSTYLIDDGYLAVWITNRRAIRAQVHRMCTSQGFGLVEEWIWLKVTSKGDPVTPIDGIWRHPYEVMLLFRRNSSGMPQAVLRRVVAAVPDVHSRKPSLKTMFEDLLPQNYCALEVFARSLTAGWWSWGDEVLKFQHGSNWH